MKIGLMKPCKNSFPLGCPGRKIPLCRFRGPQSFQHPFHCTPKASISLLPALLPSTVDGLLHALWVIFGHIMCPHMMFSIHVLGLLLVFLQHPLLPTN